MNKDEAIAVAALVVIVFFGFAMIFHYLPRLVP